jgi:hypothetical protein
MKKIIFQLALASVLCTAIPPKVVAMDINNTEAFIPRKTVPQRSWLNKKTAGIPNKYLFVGGGLSRGS